MFSSYLSLSLIRSAILLYRLPKPITREYESQYRTDTDGVSVVSCYSRAAYSGPYASSIPMCCVEARVMTRSIILRCSYVGDEQASPGRAACCGEDERPTDRVKSPINYFACLV